MNIKLNVNERRRPKILALLAISFLLLCASEQAGAGSLDAQATKSLVSGHTLQVKFGSGVVAFWTWGSDGSLCARQDAIDSACIDNGTWKVEGDRLCYELTYLGASDGWKSNCLRIVDNGQGRYEAVQENGLTFWEFSVAK
jgi:hypothetical protein